MQVYSWFLGVYKLSKVVGVVGYGLLLCELLGLGPLLRMLLPQGLAMDLVWCANKDVDCCHEANSGSVLFC